MWPKRTLKNLVYKVNGASIDIHKNLGPGLLESVYHKCLLYELNDRNIAFESELQVPIFYKNVDLSTHLRCDIFIENILVVELKSIESVLPIHKAQLLTYMKLLKAPQGLIINFNVDNIFHKGITSMVNDHFRNLKP